MYKKIPRNEKKDYAFLSIMRHHAAYPRLNCHQFSSETGAGEPAQFSKRGSIILEFNSSGNAKVRLQRKITCSAKRPHRCKAWNGV